MSNEIARTQLFNLERILHHNGPVVIDIETPGQVDPYAQGARILMIGVALSDTEAYVFKDPYIKPLLKILESKSLIAHNAKFETKNVSGV